MINKVKIVLVSVAWKAGEAKFAYLSVSLDFLSPFSSLIFHPSPFINPKIQCSPQEEFLYQLL